MNRVAEVPRRVKVNTVLISVSDKSGIEDFVRGLLEINPDVQILSTGGTHRVLENLLSGYMDGRYTENLVQVSEYTGQPEMQGGLVKTLDFRIYLGLLSEPYNNDHRQDIERSASKYIDMVVVNLYPFSSQIAREGSSLEDARSHIDIGGPTMLRASAKNYIRVASICRPEDYPGVLHELRENSGTISLDSRFRLAKKTFAHTAEYDAAISGYLQETVDSAIDDVYRVREGVWQ